MSISNKRKSISIERKLKILKEIDEKHKAYNEIAEIFGCSKGSVGDIVKNRSQIESSSCVRSRKKMRSGKFEDLEKVLVKWLSVHRQNNVNIIGSLLREKARQFAQSMGISNFKVSDGWFDRFKQRQSISFKMVVGEKSSADTNQLSNWIKDKLPQLRKTFKDKDIFNCDETGLLFKLMPNRTMCLKNDDCAGGKLSKERITILLGANLNGTEKLPVLVIGKSTKPRCFKDLKTLPVLYSANRKAWMNGVEWEAYLRKLDRKFTSQNRKILLVIDNCPAHIPVSGLKSIVVEFLPANVTSIGQPMDQGIIRNFKVLYRTFLVRKMIHNLENKVENKTTLLDAINFTKKSWDLVTVNTIKNCFKKSWNLNQILDSASDNNDIEVVGDIYDEWNNPLISSEISFNDYVDIDNNLIVADQISDADIMETIVNVQRNIEENLSDESDEEEIAAPPTFQEFESALTICKMFVMNQSGCESELQSLFSLEKSLNAAKVNSKL